MDHFRNDPSWQAFWRNKRIAKQTFLYSLVPFYEASSLFLQQAVLFWYRWSQRRSTEVAHVALALSECADMLRGNGLPLARAGVIPPFYRHHAVGGVQDEDRHIASILHTVGTHILFLIFPILENYAKEHALGTDWLDARLGKNIEILAESPFFDQHVLVPIPTLAAAIAYGSVLECEGIAYAMAVIDKACGKRKRPNVCQLSEEELAHLAEKLDVPTETLREVFSETFSSWWDACERYQKLAQSGFEHCITSLCLPSGMQDTILQTHAVGMVTNGGHTPYISPDAYVENERNAHTFLALFLMYAKRADKHFPIRGTASTTPKIG